MATAENYSSGKRKRDGGRNSIYPGDHLFSFTDEEDSTNGVFHNHDFGPNLKDKAESKTPSIPFNPKNEERDEELNKTFQSKYGGVSVGTWARVGRGKYTGDLAQVVNINEFQRKATVKLLPRLDLQAVAKNISGGITGHQYTSPAPRLITSSELDAYRVRVRHSLDPDTGDLYEVFEGMKLKDGYVFKKLALESFFFNYKPSEAELIKFMPDKNEESNDVNKKQTANNDNVGDGQGLSSSDMENGFQVPDLVTHDKTVRIVIGRENDGCNKDLEKGTEGPAVEACLLKKAVFDKKLNALDRHKKIISINDTVRVLKGPLEDKRGIVKQIYKKVLFLHDENLHKNCGYFCAKAKICEKMEVSSHLFKGKGVKSDASGIGGESVGCSEPEPSPEASPAVGYEGLCEASFVEKLRSGAQELGGLMEEAATRCLGKVSLEDQLRGVLLELELCKERVSAVEAERDTFCNSLKKERERVSAVEAERDTFCNSLKEERERVSAVEMERDIFGNSLEEERERVSIVEAERDIFSKSLEEEWERVSAVEAERDTLCNSLKEEREKIVSVFRRLLDTEVQLVTRLKEDLSIWCARYEAHV